MKDIDTAFTYRGIALVMTCGACPEQYDAINGRGEKVGYLRLRSGWFRVDYLRCGGPTIFKAEPKGDGSFEHDEREGFLKAAIDAIKEHEATQ
jgi:hypothetical protein